MPYRRISADLKERALYLWDLGWIPSDVMAVLGVSVASMYRWRKNRDKYGTVKKPVTVPQGRPRKLDAVQTDALLSYLDQQAWRYLDEIMDWLALEHNVNISRSALQENIHDAGYTYKVLRKRAARRNPDAIAAFQEFQRTYLRADMCVCVDESSKDDRTMLRHYGWAPAGERAVVEAELCRGERYSLLPAMTVDGYIAARVVKGSVKAPEFFDFIVRDVLPQMNPYPAERSVLILDNCSVHKSEALQAACDNAGIWLVYIPPYSPEFNPIEESFHAVKQWLRRNYERLCYSLTPEADLLDACRTITAEKATAFFVNSGYAL